MPVSVSSSERFRQARERAGLSVDQVAERMGIQPPCVWDIESHGEELSSVYSPAELQRFAQVLGVTPAELLGIESPGEPISAAQLVELVREHCRVSLRCQAHEHHRAFVPIGPNT